MHTQCVHVAVSSHVGTVIIRPNIQKYESYLVEHMCLAGLLSLNNGCSSREKPPKESHSIHTPRRTPLCGRSVPGNMIRPNEDEIHLAPQRVRIPGNSLDEHHVHVGAEGGARMLEVYTEDSIAFPFRRSHITSTRTVRNPRPWSPPVNRHEPSRHASDRPISSRCGQAKAPSFATSLRLRSPRRAREPCRREVWSRQYRVFR